MAKYLIENGALINKCDWRLNTPLHYAIMNNNFSATRLLLENGANPNKVDFPIITCTEFSAFNSIHLLLKYKCDIDEQDFKGNVAIHYAMILSIKKNKHDIMKLLINKKCDINILNNKKLSPLRVALNFSSIRHIKVLLQFKARIDGWSFNYAVKHNSLPCIKKLIDSGAELNPEGDYPLSYAIHRSKECTKLLVNAKADVNISDWLGKTPLFHALERPTTEATKYLISKKANINYSGYYGYSPLIYIIRNNLFHYIDILIQAKANINAQSNTGKNTVLHYAYYDNNLPVVQKLLTLGASPTIKNNDGVLPINCVKYNKEDNGKKVTKKRKLKK